MHYLSKIIGGFFSTAVYNISKNAITTADVHAIYGKVKVIRMRDVSRH